MVPNATAHLVVGARKFDATSVLRSLSVPQWIQHSLTAFECVRVTDPAYFREVCIQVARHLYPVKPPFGSTWRWLFHGPELDRRSFHVQHKSSGIPFLSLPPLNIHQLRTFKSWEHLYFKSILVLYLLTYFLRSWPENGMSHVHVPLKKYGVAGAEREREIALAERWAGVTEKCVSGEREFPPLPLCSHVLLMTKLTFYLNCLPLLCCCVYRDSFENEEHLYGVYCSWTRVCCMFCAFSFCTSWVELVEFNVPLDT